MEKEAILEKLERCKREAEKTGWSDWTPEDSDAVKRMGWNSWRENVEPYEAKLLSRPKSIGYVDDSVPRYLLPGGSGYWGHKSNPVSVSGKIKKSEIRIPAPTPLKKKGFDRLFMSKEESILEKKMDSEQYQKLREILDGPRSEEIFPRKFTLEYSYCDTCGGMTSLHGLAGLERGTIYVDDTPKIYLYYELFDGRKLNRYEGKHINPDKGKNILLAQLKNDQIQTMRDDKRPSPEGYLVKSKDSFWSSGYYISRILDLEGNEYATLHYPDWWAEAKPIWHIDYAPEVSENTSIGEKLGVVFYLESNDQRIATAYYINKGMLNNQNMLIEMNKDKFGLFDFSCALYAGGQLLGEYGRVYTPRMCPGTIDSLVWIGTNLNLMPLTIYFACEFSKTSSSSQYHRSA